MCERTNKFLRAVAAGACGILPLALAASAEAAPPAERLRLHRSAATGEVTFIEPADGAFLPVTSRAAGATEPVISFLQEYGELMGIDLGSRFFRSHSLDFLRVFVVTVLR